MAAATTSAVAIGVALARATAATSAGATGHQPFPLAAEVPETGGSTTPSIAAELRIGTGRPPTDSGERRAVIRSPTARPAPGSRSDGRAAICRVPAGEEPERAIGRAEAGAIEQEEAEQIALEAATSRAAGAETATPSEEAPGVPKDTTDRALARAVAAAHPAWDLAVVGAVVAAVAGADDVCLFEERNPGAQNETNACERNSFPTPLERRCGRLLVSEHVGFFSGAGNRGEAGTGF